MPSAKQVMARFDRLDNETERNNFKTIWQDATDYVHIRRNEIISRKQKGSQRTEKVYDSTAIRSNDLLASSLQGSLTSNSALWAKIKIAGDDFNSDDAVRGWLDGTSTAMFRAFNDSNYTLEMAEFFLDLTSVHTACVLIEEDTIEKRGFNGLNFRAYPIMDYVFEENHKGIVDTVIRKCTFTGRQAKQKFGDKAGKKVLQAAKKGDEQSFNYLHLVMPIKEYGGGRFGNPGWKFTDVYISCEDEVITRKGGYFEFPYVVARWAKASGEKYGRGPTNNALPDIKTLNAAISYMLQAWAKDINPSRLVPDSLGFTIKDVPGTNIPVPERFIEAIQKGALTSQARWEVSQHMVSDLRQAIKEAYFTDQLQIQKKAQMTATESAITFDLMQRLLGPVFGKIEKSVFTPMVERVFGIMLRAEAFDEAPPQLEGQGLEIEYVGPLARSQRMGEVAAIRKWLEALGLIGQFQPSVFDVPDFDEIAVDMGRLVGVKEKYINSEDTIIQVRDARQAQIQQDKQQERLMESADAMGKLSAYQPEGGGETEA
ncbi:MAG: portal protein [Candidatus Marinimicrobia bacterium]|jgi:hypothetical protein|nr:portal protein [Candidatus Neomarinimicrobiota bacterium]|tara:strand:- start:12896 stop:14521 length:1626 start_codon:yes stop_codon:yes gene_type:complete